MAVTANNIITINKVLMHRAIPKRNLFIPNDLLTPVFFVQDQNVFDSKKKVKLTNAEGVEYKLAKKQLQAIDFNKALLAMYTNQVRKRVL